jgi:hypothetical protein
MTLLLIKRSRLVDHSKTRLKKCLENDHSKTGQSGFRMVTVVCLVSNCSGCHFELNHFKTKLSRVFRCSMYLKVAYHITGCRNFCTVVNQSSECRDLESGCVGTYPAKQIWKKMFTVVCSVYSDLL